MHLTHPIEIDLLTFFKFGHFDFIKLGQTKEWILRNFPDPDDFGPALLSPKWPIWTYDRFEFHFDTSNRLTAIYTDYLAELPHNNRLQITPWILDQVDKLTLLYVLGELNKHAIYYEKQTGPHGVGLLLRSGLRLSFTPPEEPGVATPNEFKLTSLQLSEQSAYRWQW